MAFIQHKNLPRQKQKCKQEEKILPFEAFCLDFFLLAPLSPAFVLRDLFLLLTPSSLVFPFR